MRDHAAQLWMQRWPLRVLVIVAAMALLPAAPAARADSTGWRFTSYYTADESFGQLPAITYTVYLGNCGDGQTATVDLRSDFVAWVTNEGSGKTLLDRPDGYTYLNYSPACGTLSQYWLSVAPKSAGRDPLTAWRTAANSAYDLGTGFAVTSCGYADPDHRDPVPGSACDRFTSASSVSWVVDDRFEPGTDGYLDPCYIDLYIGMQDRYDMSTNPYYTTMYGGSISIPWPAGTTCSA